MDLGAAGVGVQSSDTPKGDTGDGALTSVSDGSCEETYKYMWGRYKRRCKAQNMTNNTATDAGHAFGTDSGQWS